MNSPWLGMVLVPSCLLALLVGLRFYQRAGGHPEVVRKLLHVGMGLVTLSLPWLFDQAWPVIVLGCSSAVLMLAMRFVKKLRAGVGGVVCSVDRFSLGEVYFPLAVALLFTLYLHEQHIAEDRRVLLYCVPLLLLTLADALAALVGISYGRWRYTTPDGQKTAEGSFTFFMVAFLVTHILILLATDVGRAETLLIAFLLAWLATMFEAVAWAGLDNLLLPVVAFLLLRSYFHMSVQSLALLLGITTGLTLLVAVYRRRTTLQGSALIGAVLVGYVTWTLGGWRWLLPPLLLFLCYARLSPQPEGVSRREHNMHAVVSVCSSGLIWLFLADLLRRPELLFLFTLAFAAHLSIIGAIRIKAYHPQLSALVIIAISTLSAWGVLVVPHVVLEGFTQNAVICGLIGLPVIALATVAFCVTQPHLHDCPIDTPRWLRQAIHSAAGSILGLVPLYVF